MFSGFLSPRSCLEESSNAMRRFHAQVPFLDLSTKKWDRSLRFFPPSTSSIFSLSFFRLENKTHHGSSYFLVLLSMTRFRPCLPNEFFSLALVLMELVQREREREGVEFRRRNFLGHFFLPHFFFGSINGRRARNEWHYR